MRDDVERVEQCLVAVVFSLLHFGLSVNEVLLCFFDFRLLLAYEFVLFAFCKCLDSGFVLHRLYSCYYVHNIFRLLLVGLVGIEFEFDIFQRNIGNRLVGSLGYRLYRLFLLLFFFKFVKIRHLNHTSTYSSRIIYPLSENVNTLCQFCLKKFYNTIENPVNLYLVYCYHLHVQKQ